MSNCNHPILNVTSSTVTVADFDGFLRGDADLQTVVDNIDDNIPFDLQMLLICIGIINKGVRVQANTGLSASLIAGELVVVDMAAKEIKTVAIPAQTPMVFDYMTEDGTIVSTGNTAFDFTQYSLNNVPTLVVGNDATMQRIYLKNDGSNIIVKYAQESHTTLTNAITRWNADTVDTPAILDDYICIGGVIGRADTIDITDVNFARFVDASKLGHL